MESSSLAVDEQRESRDSESAATSLKFRTRKANRTLRSRATLPRLHAKLTRLLRRTYQPARDDGNAAGSGAKGPVRTSSRTPWSYLAMLQSFECHARGPARTTSLRSGRSRATASSRRSLSRRSRGWSRRRCPTRTRWRWPS